MMRINLCTLLAIGVALFGYTSADMLRVTSFRGGYVQPEIYEAQCGQAIEIAWDKGEEYECWLLPSASCPAAWDSSVEGTFVLQARAVGPVSAVYSIPDSYSGKFFLSDPFHCDAGGIVEVKVRCDGNPTYTTERGGGSGVSVNAPGARVRVGDGGVFVGFPGGQAVVSPAGVSVLYPGGRTTVGGRLRKLLTSYRGRNLVQGDEASADDGSETAITVEQNSEDGLKVEFPTGSVIVAENGTVVNAPSSATIIAPGQVTVTFPGGEVVTLGRGAR